MTNELFLVREELAMEVIKKGVIGLDPNGFECLGDLLCETCNSYFCYEVPYRQYNLDVEFPVLLSSNIMKRGKWKNVTVKATKLMLNIFDVKYKYTPEIYEVESEISCPYDLVFYDYSESVCRSDAYWDCPYYFRFELDVDYQFLKETFGYTKKYMPGYKTDNKCCFFEEPGFVMPDWDILLENVKKL